MRKKKISKAKNNTINEKQMDKITLNNTFKNRKFLFPLISFLIYYFLYQINNKNEDLMKGDFKLIQKIKREEIFFT